MVLLLGACAQPSAGVAPAGSSSAHVSSARATVQAPRASCAPDIVCDGTQTYTPAPRCKSGIEVHGHPKHDDCIAPDGHWRVEGATCGGQVPRACWTRGGGPDDPGNCFVSACAEP